MLLQRYFMGVREQFLILFLKLGRYTYTEAYITDRAKVVKDLQMQLNKFRKMS